MPATPGSVYQAILLQHIANTPPNAYPQTAFETFGQYQIRMASQGLPVDIGATESDAAYLARLASLQPGTPSANVSASFALTAVAGGITDKFILTDTGSAAHTASFINGVLVTFS